MRIINLIGVASSGKSTIMKKVIKETSGVWVKKKYKKLRFLLNAENKTIVLGLYNDDPADTFQGTDKLSMNIYDDTLEFLRKWRERHQEYTILIEGDRYTNSKFFIKLQEDIFDHKILALNISDKELKKRQFARGNRQSEEFLKRSNTKISNITESFACETFKNNNKEQQEAICCRITQMMSV